MNIACTACSARYGVADEKLVGKRVRITCKRCGTVLIVDGNYNPPTVSASTSIPPSPPASSRPPVESRRPVPAPEPPFTVAFADGRQEQADVAQIVRFHRAGQLGTDSLVWREGMADWADPWDVPDIAAAFRRMGYGRPTPAPSFPPAAQPLREPVEEEATQIHRSSPQHVAPPYGDNEDTHVTDSSRRGVAAARRDQRVAARHVVEDDEVPTQVGLPAQAAARRASQSPREPQRARRVSSQPAPRESAAEEYQRARREAKALSSARARSSRPPLRPSEPAPDMFARHSRAGSEEEQVEQSSLGAVHDPDAPRLTGARNESSVLFSLDTLLKQDQQKKSAPPPPPPRRDESFLVDSGGSLPVGGGIAPALAAPDFTAPISVAPPAPRYAEPLTFEDTGRTRSSRAWVYVAALVVLGGGGALAWKSGALDPLLVKVGVSTPPVPAVPVPSSTATAEPTARAAESATAAAAASATPEASGTASASPPSTSAATPPATARGTGAAPVARASQSSSKSSSSTKEASSTTKETSSDDEGSAKESAAKEPVAKEPVAKEAAAAPFDPAAAKEALTGATANVANCKEMGGPTGNGRVSITFAPSGRPTSVAVTGDLAGTTVGSCIARLYRAVRVPAFSGDPVTVAKGFSVQ